MHRYNKLKLKVLSLFASAVMLWIGPREARRTAQFLTPALGMVIFQKVVEIRIAGETLLRQGNIGIQDQRARRGTSSLVTFAARLMLKLENHLSGVTRLIGTYASS